MVVLLRLRRTSYEKPPEKTKLGGIQMALYKYKQILEASEDGAFDQLMQPSAAAPWPGIYHCHACGHEIGIAHGHTLPPQNHHQHAPGIGPIQWRLIVSHKKY